MKVLLLVFSLLALNTKLSSQVLYEKIGDSYFTVFDAYVFSGPHIDSLVQIESAFLARGLECYLDYDFGDPFIFMKGRVIFPAITTHLDFQNRDSSFNYVVIASSPLFSTSILGTTEQHKTALNTLFSPHKHLTKQPMIYGLGLDTLGGIMTLTIRDSTITFYSIPCDSTPQFENFETKVSTFDNPFDFKLVGEGQFKCITVWQEKIGTVGLVGGIHKILISPSGISVLKTFETPMNIIRYWESPFYLNHRLTAAGSKKLKSK
jgi:hypothetical protein